MLPLTLTLVVTGGCGKRRPTCNGGPAGGHCAERRHSHGRSDGAAGARASSGWSYNRSHTTGAAASRGAGGGIATVDRASQVGMLSNARSMDQRGSSGGAEALARRRAPVQSPLQLSTLVTFQVGCRWSTCTTPNICSRKCLQVVGSFFLEEGCRGGEE